MSGWDVSGRLLDHAASQRTPNVLERVHAEQQRRQKEALGREQQLWERGLEEEQAAAFREQNANTRERNRREGLASDRAFRKEAYEARQKAAELLRAGRPGEARAVLQVFGMDLDPVDDMSAAEGPPGPAAPGLPQQPPGPVPQMRPPGQGGTALPDQLEFQDPDRAATMPPPQGPGLEQLMAGAVQQGAQPRPQDPVNPILQGFGAQQAQNQRRAEMVRTGGRAPQSIPGIAGTYRVRGQNGEEFMLDPMEGERVAIEARQRKLGGLDQSFGGNEAAIYKRYWPVVKSAVEAGAIPPEKAYESMVALYKDDEDNRLKEAAIDARRRRGGAGRPKGLTEAQQADDERADEKDARDLVNKTFANLGFKELNVQNKRFNKMANMLSSKNAALDAAVAGEWVKQAQGGTGVISDSDMEAFWSRIGGVKTRTGQWVQDVLDGKIEQGKREIVAQAVMELAARARENLNEIRENLDHQFGSSPRLSKYRDQMVGAYFTDERRKIEDARKIDAAKNRARAGKLKGGGRDSLDKDLGSL